MKITFLVVLLVAVVVCVSAQRCSNPSNVSCVGARNEGFTRRGLNCGRNAGTRWYYNSRTRSCISFSYRGCGGNNNRWCSKSQCDQRCDRRPSGATAGATPAVEEVTEAAVTE